MKRAADNDEPFDGGDKMPPKDTEDKFAVLQSEEFNNPTHPRRTRPVLSKYERARILAIRAEQIGSGTHPLVDRLDGDEPAQTAEREFAAGLIPYIVRRYLPNGTCEDWRLDELGACDRRLSHKN